MSRIKLLKTGVKSLLMVTCVLLLMGAGVSAQSASPDYKRQTRSDFYKNARKLVKDAESSYKKGRYEETIEQYRTAAKFFLESVGESVEVASAQLNEADLLAQLNQTDLPTAARRDPEYVERLYREVWHTFESLMTAGVVLSPDSRGDAVRSLRSWIRYQREAGKRPPDRLVIQLTEFDLQRVSKPSETPYIVKRNLKDLLWASDFNGARQLLKVLGPRVQDARALADEAITELVYVLADVETPGYRVKEELEKRMGRFQARQQRDNKYLEAAKALDASSFPLATRLLEEVQDTKKLVDRPQGEYLIAPAPVIPDDVRFRLSAAVLFDLRDGPSKADPLLRRSLTELRRTVGLQSADWAESDLLADLLGRKAGQLWEAGLSDAARLRALVAARLTAIRLRLSLSRIDDASQLTILRRTIPEHASRLLSMCGADECLEEAYSLMLSWKGLMIQRLREEALFTRGPSQEERDVELDKLRRSREALAGLLYRSPISMSRTDRDAAKVAVEAQKAESEARLRQWSALTTGQAIREILTSGLGDEGASMAGLSVDPLRDVGVSGDLQSFLSLLYSDEAFVDAYRYRLLRGRDESEEHIGLVIAVPGQRLRFVDAGPATVLNEAIVDWRFEVLAGGNGASAWDILTTALWKSLARQVSATRIWFSPDGELSRIPIHLLCASPCTSAITQIDAPREFVRLRRVPPTPSPQVKVVVAGGINYGLEGSASGAIRFHALGGTQRELDAITSLARTASFDVTPISGRGLTKGALADAAADARYLHLATHGFFVSDETYDAGTTRKIVPSMDSVGEDSEVFVRHPLMASGIAISDANLSGASGPSAPGLITAEELIGLNFSRTDLVTLSACETGRGAEVTSQGVLGLRAALMSTGVRSALLSLWKVGDDSTVEFMTEFYTQLWAGASKADALKKAQESMRDQPTRDWAAWVLAGEGW